MNYEETFTNIVRMHFDAKKVVRLDGISDTTWNLTKKDIIPNQAQAIALEARQDGAQLLEQFSKDDKKPEGLGWGQLADKFNYILEQETKAWIDKQLN